MIAASHPLHIFDNTPAPFGFSHCQKLIGPQCLSAQDTCLLGANMPSPDSAAYDPQNAPTAISKSTSGICRLGNPLGNGSAPWSNALTARCSRLAGEARTAVAALRQNQCAYSQTCSLRRRRTLLRLIKWWRSAPATCTTISAAFQQRLVECAWGDGLQAGMTQHAAVGRYWVEARRSIEGKNWTAAALMARSAIQLVARSSGAEGVNIKAEIDDLAAKGVLLPIMREWAHEVRLIANEGTHPKPGTAGTDEKDAKDVVEFLSFLMSVMYDLPKQIEDYRKRKA
jgi:hypothetical protein